MKHESLLRRNDTALVVIDIQEKLLPAMHEQERVLQRTQILLKAAEIMKLPVIFSEQYPKGLGHTLPELRELAPQAAVIEKMSFSCARNEEFMAALKKTGANQVLICGIEAHVCVLQTALDVIMTGRQVHIVADAVSSRNPNMCLGAIMRVSKAGVTVTNSESALFEMLDEAVGDDFKAISRLVR